MIMSETNRREFLKLIGVGVFAPSLPAAEVVCTVVR